MEKSESNLSKYFDSIDPDSSINTKIAKASNEINLILKSLNENKEIINLKEKLKLVLEILNSNNEDEMLDISLDSDSSERLNLIKSFSLSRSQHKNNTITFLSSNNIKSIRRFSLQNNPPKMDIIAEDNEINTNKDNIRRMSKVVNVVSHLKNIETFNFNIFSLDSELKEKVLPFVTNHVFNKLGFISDNDLTFCNSNTFSKFIDEISVGYNRNVQYHNDTHAADVFQTVYSILCQSKIHEVRII